MGYSQFKQREYEKLLQEAIEAIGLKMHVIASRGLRTINRDIFYDCTRCGALVSLLDVHIATCQQITYGLRMWIRSRTFTAREHILDMLNKQKDTLTAQELEQLEQCGHGPHLGRLELLQYCSEIGVDAYCYSVAEKQLIEERLVASFTVLAVPEHDLQIMLVTQVAVANQ